MQHLFFNTRDEQTKVELEKVVYFEAFGNLTHVFFINRHKATLSIGLSKIEQLLKDPKIDSQGQFIRIGRQYIVNRRFIFQINLLKQKLLLSDMANMPVCDLSISKEALKKLKDILINKQ